MSSFLNLTLNILYKNNWSKAHQSQQRWLQNLEGFGAFFFSQKCDFSEKNNPLSHTTRLISRKSLGREGCQLSTPMLWMLPPLLVWQGRSACKQFIIQFGFPWQVSKSLGPSYSVASCGRGSPSPLPQEGLPILVPNSAPGHSLGPPVLAGKYPNEKCALHCTFSHLIPPLSEEIPLPGSSHNKAQSHCSFPPSPTQMPKSSPSRNPPCESHPSSTGDRQSCFQPHLGCYFANQTWLWQGWNWARSSVTIWVQISCHW